MLCGGGILNKLIDKLPFELHLPGYKFCGPGTKLQEKLSKGVNGRNPLDNFCKAHDIAYDRSKDVESRHIADRILVDQAWSRVKSKDSSLGEKAAAWMVTNMIKAKLKTGSGLDKFKNSKKKKCQGGSVAIKIRKRKTQKKQGKKARTLPTPKSGGFIPLAAIPAVIGMVSALASGGAAVASSFNNIKSSYKTIADIKRNQNSKQGSGFYLKPYQKRRV